MVNKSLAQGVPGLTFDEIRHEYYLDGKSVPSVTRIISNIPEEMMMNNAFIRAGNRGTAVHKVCELMNLGQKVNIKGLAKEVIPYVNGYIKFLQSKKYTVAHAETRVVSVKYRYAGTVDIIAVDDKGHLFIMDIKTSAVVSPTTALQLAAYEQAWREMNKIPKSTKIGRIAIWLTGDDNYELVHFKDPNDLNVYNCKLVGFNWDRRNGLK